MSQDILENVLEKIIDSKNDEFIKFLLQFKVNEFIYPSIIKRKFNIEPKKIYEIFLALEKAGLVKMYYELFCYECNHPSGLCEYFNQLNDKLVCVNCDNILDIKNNTKIVYKVVK